MAVHLGQRVLDLLELILESDGRKDVSTRHRAHLDEMLQLHAATAIDLDVAALEADIGILPVRLREVIVATIAWIRASTCSAASRIAA